MVHVTHLNYCGTVRLNPEFLVGTQDSAPNKLAYSGIPSLVPGSSSRVENC